jgi:leader peptidase (prepilin peptidase) / N-methyltransferase
MAPALAAPFGLIIGSFLNVVAYRLPRGESLVHPPSRCTSCGHEVRPYDNVPVFSWLLLRGRCRHCAGRISARYPLVELLTGVAFAAVALVRGVRPELALDLPFVAMLIVVAGIDLEHKIVPNKVLLPLACWGVAAGFAIRPDAMPTLLIAGAGAFTALLVTALVYPAGMGMGDVKLAGVIGLYIGVSVIPALAVAFLCGSVVGVAILVRARGGRGHGVPFAPFMALGGLVGLLAGHDLIHFYTHTFLH